MHNKTLNPAGLLTLQTVKGVQSGSGAKGLRVQSWKGKMDQWLKRWSQDQNHHINLTVHEPHDLRNNGTVRVIIRDHLAESRHHRKCGQSLDYNTHRPSPIKHNRTEHEAVVDQFLDMLTVASLWLPAVSWRRDRNTTLLHVSHRLVWGTPLWVLSNRRHPHFVSGQTFVKTSLYPWQPLCTLN